MRPNTPSSSTAHPADTGPVLVIHGGAGTIPRHAMSEREHTLHRAALSEVLRAGEQLLAAGAPALEVVTEAVRLLEDCEHFNAGRGAVYTADGGHELDACVMDGRDRRAGAVAGVRTVRNPIRLARCVMERTPHAFLIGAAADALAAREGLEIVDPAWFGTPLRRAQLEAAQRAAAVRLDHDTGTPPLAADQPSNPRTEDPSRFGTVGAVALDVHGHLAAATSTGGMTNKWPGRVGDSPIVGAGCYAFDGVVAVSCTGTGEAFIRCSAAHEVGALMRLAGLSVSDAAHRVVHEELPRVDGQGGLIAVSATGEIALPFNTGGMYRGWVRPGASPVVGIHEDLSG